PFPAAVPAQVVVDAVAVVLAISLVVLVVVAHQVVQREAVVTGDEVDAIDGQMAAGLVDVGAATQAGRDGTDHAPVAFHETADVIAIPAVPFGPAEAGEVADLVQTSGVPGLGDDLGVVQGSG